MDEQEFAELAAGAALNALSPADRAAFEAARREHPEWEHWIETDAATAVALADTVSDAVPPLTLRSTLLSRIATTPQLPAMDAAVAATAEPVDRWTPAPPPAPERHRDEPPVEPPPPTAVIQAVSRRRWTRGILALAASMVLLVALGLGAVQINEYMNRPPEVVALQQIEDAPDARSATVEVADGGTSTAHWSESVGKVVLVSQGLPQIADDESFELWFVRDGGAVPAGVFEPTDGTTTALLEGAMEPGDVIAVTIEPQGGSPTGEPSSDPIVTIPTA
ncbi:anti-sigma factor [Microbacterium sp. Leaf288]|uniref:anti-sigma factor n=1 Tax=Microbacterium sp. Leaf288 TaxID=1736323 RepID=UPI0006FBD33F|nr:anti-sigma factor [Microbacterium sp. Leaf288]KQP70498.1 anti-sigma factor [Microbacterium sp. Leaf288]